MTTADKLTYLAVTKTIIHDAIEFAGLPIPAGTPFREYPQYLETALSISVLMDFLGGIPADAAFSRASTKVSTDPVTGNPRTLPAELPDYNMRLIDHADGQDYGFNVLGYEYVTDDGAGGELPGPFKLQLDSANGGTLADGLSVDLSAHTDEQIKSAKIKSYDGSDNLVVDDLFGPELITNGDFSDGLNDWTAAAGWVSDEGAKNTSAGDDIYQLASLEVGFEYLLQVTVDATADSVLENSAVQVRTSAGHYVSAAHQVQLNTVPYGGTVSVVSLLFTAADVNRRVRVYSSDSITLKNVTLRQIHPDFIFDKDTKILTFNTPLSLAASNPVVLL